MFIIMYVIGFVICSFLLLLLLPYFNLDFVSAIATLFVLVSIILIFTKPKNIEQKNCNFPEETEIPKNNRKNSQMYKSYSSQEIRLENNKLNKSG